MKIVGDLILYSNPSYDGDIYHIDTVDTITYHILPLARILLSIILQKNGGIYVLAEMAYLVRKISSRKFHETHASLFAGKTTLKVRPRGGC